jgi:hypothetical protein
MDIDINEVLAGMRAEIGRLSQELVIANLVNAKHEAANNDKDAPDADESA